MTYHLHTYKPPSNFIAGRPKAALLFGSLVILDVARCYLWLFSLYTVRAASHLPERGGGALLCIWPLCMHVNKKSDDYDI